MIIRQALNFAAHLVVGVAMGALAITACKALERRDEEQWGAREPSGIGEKDFQPGSQ